MFCNHILLDLSNISLPKLGRQEGEGSQQLPLRRILMKAYQNWQDYYQIHFINFLIDESWSENTKSIEISSKHLCDEKYFVILVLLPSPLFAGYRLIKFSPICLSLNKACQDTPNLPVFQVPLCQLNVLSEGWTTLNAVKWHVIWLVTHSGDRTMKKTECESLMKNSLTLTFITEKSWNELN